jgi:hypothetical protein
MTRETRFDRVTSCLVWRASLRLVAVVAGYPSSRSAFCPRYKVRVFHSGHPCVTWSERQSRSATITLVAGIYKRATDCVAAVLCSHPHHFPQQPRGSYRPAGFVHLRIDPPTRRPVSSPASRRRPTMSDSDSAPASPTASTPGPRDSAAARELLCCPICCDLLVGPAVTPCGHAFCLQCFEVSQAVRWWWGDWRKAEC